MAIVAASIRPAVTILCDVKILRIMGCSVKGSLSKNVRFHESSCGSYPIPEIASVLHSKIVHDIIVHDTRCGGSELVLYADGFVPT